jgi:hypothetical protein
MIRLKIIKSTDNKYIGDEIVVPTTALRTMKKKQIQAFAKTIYDGRFVPDHVSYPDHNSVRLVNSNYSVTFKEFENAQNY